MKTRSMGQREITDESNPSISSHGPGSGGNGKGNGHGKTRTSPVHAERLEDQPSIAAILGGKTPGGQLDRTRLLAALTAFKSGDFSVRLPLDLEGMAGKIADAFNDVIERNENE